MRWMLEVAYIGIATSWKWLLGSTAVVAALVIQDHTDLLPLGLFNTDRGAYGPMCRAIWKPSA